MTASHNREHFFPARYLKRFRVLSRNQFPLEGTALSYYILEYTPYPAVLQTPLISIPIDIRRKEKTTSSPFFSSLLLLFFFIFSLVGLLLITDKETDRPSTRLHSPLSTVLQNGAVHSEN